MIPRWSFAALGSAAIAGLCVAAPAAQAQQQVGTAAAVNPAAQAGGRVLQIGSNIVFKERVTTTASGNIQVLFIDKTTLNIGPNSDVLIDEFVYDPRAGTGRMTITMAKGVMRIVGGNVTHTEGATVRTPAASVGIRGGTGSFIVGPGQTKVINHFGKFSVSAGGTTVSLYRPEFAVTVGGGGQVSNAVKVTSAELALLNANLTSKPHQTGGAANVPTQQQTLAAGTGNSISNDPTTMPSNQPQTASGAQSTAPDPPPASSTENTITQAQQQSTTDQTAQQVAPTTKIYALQTIGTPFLPPSGFTAPGMQVSPLLGYRRGGVNETGDGRFGSGVIQAGFAISGAGAAQSSTFFVMTGSFTSLSADGTDQFLSGGFTATTRTAANQTMSRANGAASDVPGTLVLDGDRIPTALTINQDNRDSATGALSPDTAGTINPNTSYTYSNSYTQVAVPPGTGTDRTGQALTGFVGGVMQTRHATSPSAGSSVPVGLSFPVVGDVAINFELDRPRVQAVANIAKAANANGDQFEFNNAVLQVGNLSPTARGRGVYIDDHLFAARAAITEPPGQNTVQTEISSVNGVQLSRSNQAFASSEIVDVQGAILAINPSIVFCACEYTRWGAWSVDTARLNNDSSEERDRAHIMMWVAGRKSNSVDIPVVGSASYTGHILGAFKNNSTGNEYLSGSSFVYNANFGSPSSSTMSVANLDGVTYAGTLSFNRPTNTISGSIPGTGGPVVGSATMTLNGAFFQGRTDPVKDVAGNFLVRANSSGPNFNYVGSGIFAGSRP